MEPNAPQPGRIPPIQVAGPVPPVQKTASATATAATTNPKAKATSLITSQVQGRLQKLPEPVKKNLNTIVGAAANPVFGGLALGGQMLNARIVRKNKKNMSRFQQDIEKYGKGSIPKTKSRISTPEQIVLICFCAFIDLAEIIIDFFPPVAVIVNRVVDAIMATILFGYALFKGLTWADHSKIYESIIGTVAGEFVPYLDVLPFFTADAWFITRALKKEARDRQNAMDAEADAIIKDKERRNWMETYQIQQAQAQSEAEAEQTEERKAA